MPTSTFYKFLFAFIGMVVLTLGLILYFGSAEQDSGVGAGTLQGGASDEVEVQRI